VFSDTPRYIGCFGGEGCIAGDTLIEGIPVAERVHDAPVTTLYGPAIGSAGYRKGQADLYRVQMRSGRSVVVTLDHRFLTPNGWYPLRSLAVGSLLAAHDTEHDRQSWQTAKDYPGHYSQGFHPYDALPTPLRVDALDKWRQLANSLCGKSIRGFSHFPLLYHPCNADVQAHEGHFLLDYAGRFPLDPSVVANIHRSCQIHAQPPTRTNQIDITQLHGEDLLRGASLCAGDRCLLDLDDTQHLQRLYQADPQSLDYSYRSDTDRWFVDGAVNEHCPYPIAVVSSSYLLDNQCDHYKTFWDEIQSISFVGYGDYYDLTVPGAEHYSAHGLWHHNSGKSVAGTIKTLERLRRGMHGILVSPDLEHFKKSLWREFTLWCPWHMVTARYQYMSAVDWQPSEPFILTFVNGAQLICGGIKEDQVGSWEGPNVHFFHFDEARRHKTAAALKVLTGRIRLTGPNGEPPQGWITSTPRKHWLYEYFGPWDKKDAPDPRAEFKKRAAVVRLRTLENQQNLDAEYVEARRSSLNESEARVVLNAEWEDEQDSEAFLESMILWDACRADLPPLKRNEPLVLAADAGYKHDYFALVGVSGYPGQRGKLAVRYVRVWRPQRNQQVQFSEVEAEIRRMCKQYAVTVLTFDAHQMGQMAQRLLNDGVVMVEEFSQGPRREKADKGLYDLIVSRLLAHDGNADLKEGIANADRKITEDRKLRLVKRTDSLHIDAAVSLSMSCDEALKLGLDQ
jgi:hypothetical protein